MMPTGVDLRQQRARVVEQMRAITDHAESEDRNLEPDEREKFDKLEADFADYGERIERVEASEQRARDEAPPPAPNNAHPSRGEELNTQFRELAAGDRRSVTVDFGRDLTVGTDTAGGNTVPDTFVRRLYEHMTELSAIRRTNVKVVTTSSAEPMQIPKLTSHGTAGWIGEGAQLPTGDPAFGQVELGAHKAGQIIQLSNELIADTAVNLLDFVARDAGRALGELTGASYINGTGTGQPTGILPNVTVGQTTATGQVDTLTAGDIRSLYYSVIEPYRQNAFWLMNDATLAELATLQDPSGQYILHTDMTTGVPNRLMGRQVVTDHNMPTLAAGARVILFGWFGGYTIRDVGQMRFERSNDFRFDTDLVAFRSVMRTDGKLIDTTGAVKALQTAAS